MVMIVNLQRKDTGNFIFPDERQPKAMGFVFSSQQGLNTKLPLYILSLGCRVVPGFLEP